MRSRNRDGDSTVRRPRRLSVVAYLLTAFAVSVATLVGVTAMTTADSFERERRRAESELRAAAMREVGFFEDVSDIDSFFEQMTTQPAMVALDPAGCQAVFDGLRGLLDAHVHLVRTDGSQVCGLTEERAPDAIVEPGPWLTKALATDEVITEPPALDPFADTPATLTAKRVMGPSGPVGVVVASLYSGFPPVDQPKELAPETAIFIVDAERSLVMATTPNRSRFLGAEIDGRPDLPGDNIWVEVTGPASGLHAQAVVPRDVALATARSELLRTMLIGGTSVLIVLVLGVILHRRLARPVRRLGRALQASLDGDESARAPVEGPTEVAHAAEVFNDLITERQAREASLAWQASHDMLTSLPNRAALTAELEVLLVGTGRDDVAALFLDLDRFKLVNDSHGHAVGDQVLIALGHRLAEAVGATGTLGRFGGDEFVAVCGAIGGETGAALLAARLADALKAPVRIDGQEIWLGGSVGIAVARPGDTAEDLIRNADTAMYRAKENGRGDHAVFDQGMREWAVRRLDLERDLHRAVERDELLLHYQPKVDLETGGPVGVEALLRWSHPDRGMVAPGEFIPVAEETGLIVPIGRWVIEQAAAQAARWRRAAGHPVPVAVNLSTHQLADPALPGEVAEALMTADALPTDIIIEITESAVLQDVDGSTARLTALRDLGIKVSIDDFGTGYSSLSYLQRLPIDELKIDRSFVMRLGDRSTGAIVGSVVDLAHAIGLRVVAEGIETGEQLAILRALACDLGQGFLLARPAPAEVATALLRRGSLVPAPAP